MSFTFKTTVDHIFSMQASILYFCTMQAYVFNVNYCTFHLYSKVKHKLSRNAQMVQKESYLKLVDYLPE